MNNGSPKASPQPVAFHWLEYTGTDRTPSRDLRPGEYRNPILAGFYPDPSICRTGNDYYLVNSTFEYFPGLPIFHSTDLVSWRQIGNIIHRSGQLDYRGQNINAGLFAPAISFHDGVFYVICTMIEGPGNFLVTATDPAGPWSDPVPLGFGGIDPSLFFDDNARVWVVNNDAPDGTPLYDGHRAVRIQEYDPKTKTMVGSRPVLINGGVDLSQKPIWIEGPHVFKRNGWYYLCCAEGGTGPGHSQVIFRSRTVDGRYEPWEKNPILTQRDLAGNAPGAVTCTGHADLTVGPDGRWWGVFLGVRPYRDGLSPMGRETFMLPVAWTEDEWPLILPPGERVPLEVRGPKGAATASNAKPMNGSFGWREEFTGPDLDLDWLMIRAPRETWWELTGDRLGIVPGPETLTGTGNPSYLARRVQHDVFSAQTELDLPQEAGVSAGLALVMNEKYHFFLAVRREGERALVCLERVNAGRVERVASAGLKTARGSVVLGIDFDQATCSFLYRETGHDWTTLVADADATSITSSSPDMSTLFLGATIGPHARLDGDFVYLNGNLRPVRPHEKTTGCLRGW